MSELTPEEFPDVKFEYSFLKGFPSGTSQRLLEWGKEIAALQLAKVHRLDKETLQERVTDYVRGVPNFPLEEGQLVSMVILHFDIPDEKAKVMVNKALNRLDREGLREKIRRLIDDLIVQGYNCFHQVDKNTACADQILALFPTEEEIRE